MCRYFCRLLTRGSEALRQIVASLQSISFMSGTYINYYLGTSTSIVCASCMILRSTTRALITWIIRYLNLYFYLFIFHVLLQMINGTFSWEIFYHQWLLGHSCTSFLSGVTTPQAAGWYLRIWGKFSDWVSHHAKIEVAEFLLIIFSGIPSTYHTTDICSWPSKEHSIMRSFRDTAATSAAESWL